MSVTAPPAVLPVAGSIWRDRMSLAILDLQERGVIQMLYNTWWKDTGAVCNRDENKSDSKASELGIENIGQSGAAARADRHSDALAF